MEWWKKCDRRHRAPLASALGFFDKCNEFANDTIGYQGTTNPDPGVNDGRDGLCYYYSRFESCFNEEMAKRFKFDGY